MSSTLAEGARAPTRIKANVHFVLTLWTDDPERAAAADHAGIDRVGLDLERLGKRERQADPDLWQTTHDESSLAVVGARLRRAKLFARTNPPHAGWAAEADRLIDAGARVLMLPAFRSAIDVGSALDAVGDRALLVPLIETLEALSDAPAIARLDGLTEVHFGLNDLAISMKLPSRFAVLARPELARAAHEIAVAGVRVAVGGIGRAQDERLPVPSDLVYAQYPRLRATGALIARSFFTGLAPGPAALADAVAAARARIAHWYRAAAPELERARVRLEAAP